MKFKGYSINPSLLDALSSLGYIELTPVQEATITPILKGKSIVAKSQTGSGKTHAYLVPTISRLNYSLNKIQAIILEPTIELCNQCYRFAESLAQKAGNFRVLNASGVNDIPVLEKPAILISTPGKLDDLLFKKKLLDISSVKSVVLDESDMLLEGDDSQNVISLVDYIDAEQRLIFTATMKEHQIASIKKLFRLTEVIDVDKGHYASKSVRHHFVDIKHRTSAKALELFIKSEQPYFTLIFASKKNEIHKIYQEFNEKGIKCAIISSEVSLRERKNTIKLINEGEYNIVLCSDLASRGLDFEKVSHVISLDIPNNIDYYYHRAGRTGRYKDQGDSYIFYDDDRNAKAKGILEKKLKFDYFILREEGLKADKKRNPQPKKKNEKLEAEIKKELAKVRSKKVKPNYKKKMRKAIKKATRNHKRKIIIENLKSKRKASNFVE